MWPFLFLKIPKLELIINNSNIAVLTIEHSFNVSKLMNALRL